MACTVLDLDFDNVCCCFRRIRSLCHHKMLLERLRERWMLYTYFCPLLLGLCPWVIREEEEGLNFHFTEKQFLLCVCLCIHKSHPTDWKVLWDYSEMHLQKTIELRCHKTHRAFHHNSLFISRSLSLVYMECDATKDPIRCRLSILQKNANVVLVK